MRIRRRQRPTKGNVLTRALRGLGYDIQMLAYDSLERVSYSLAQRSTYGPLSPHRRTPTPDDQAPPGHDANEATAGICHGCPNAATTEFTNRVTGEVTGWCDDCVGTFANSARAGEWRMRTAATMRSSRPKNRA
jgi:hypothetical protein